MRPTLEYAASVWSAGQKTLIDTLEKVQKREARYVCNKFKKTDKVSSMIAHLKWDTLAQRRDKSRVTMLFKIYHKLVSIPATKLIPKARETRRHNLRFHRINAKTNYHFFSFYPWTIRLWDDLPQNLVSVSDLDVFKDHLKSVKLKPIVIS